MRYTLQENNAGSLLLTVKEDGNKLLIFTFTPKTMGEYLHLLRDGADLETMESEAWDDTVDPDEYDKYASEWQDSPIIADSAGVYTERAGVAGEKALQIADHDAVSPLAAVMTLAYLDARRKTLEARIERFTAYVEQDKALCSQSEQHAKKYASRLRNHSAKLARHKESLAAVLADYDRLMERL